MRPNCGSGLTHWRPRAYNAAGIKRTVFRDRTRVAAAALYTAGHGSHAAKVNQPSIWRPMIASDCW